MYKKVINFINQVSTPPSRLSWQWTGSISILSFVSLHLIYILRAISLLQLLKLIYRTVAKRLKINSVDKGAKRTNIPVWFVEVYFLAVTATTLIMPYNCLTKYIFIFFMVESTIWLIYYNIFRRFFEENYSIVHALEYMILIPTLFTLQASCFAALSQNSLSMAIKLMLCPSPEVDCPIYIIILFVLYTAIILSLVLTNLPAERIKMNMKRPNYIAVIGAGDIVKNRLIPILGATRQNVCVIDIESKAIDTCREENKEFPMINYIVETPANSVAIDREIMNSSILWVATPPMAHIAYLEEWLNRNIFIVIEKPLISLKQELELLTEMMDSPQWDRVFSLSYYYLEKALPLTYIYSPLKFYEKYLLFTNNKSREDILSAVTQLGKITSFTAKIVEGNDSRTWANQNRYGGQYMETFIHVAMLTKLVFGVDSEIDNIDWSETSEVIERGKPYTIRCKGEINGAEIDISISKFMEDRDCCRKCKISYENGKINVDLEKKSCTLKSNINPQINDFTISLADDYKDKNYSVQYDMASRCYNEHIRPATVDGSKLQKKTIEWLFEQQIENGII